MSGVPSDWQPLLRELDAWAAEGKVATLWWRDDDAIEPTAQLDRMLSLANRFGVPLGLAVIPARARPALADRLTNQPLVQVMQHGYCHHNHAGTGERAAEFGMQRPSEVSLAEQSQGWKLLDGFSRRVPIFVPPWNRYAIELATGFSRQGLSAISAFSVAKQLPFPIVECNCHVDIISWRTSRGFAGVGKSVMRLVDHLHARRTGSAPVTETTGLLSHHLVHDDGCWTFLDQLFGVLESHAAVRWVSPMDAVAAAVASGR